MSVVDALNHRRSCRAFDSSRAVSDATLDSLLRLASRAPSGGNTQPWHVTVVRGERLRALSAAVRVRVATGELSEETTPFRMYPARDASSTYMARRRLVAKQLYQLMGVG